MSQNSDYWKKRFEELQNQALEHGEDLYNELKKQYKLAYTEIEKTIAYYYNRFATDNSISFTEAKKILTAGESQEFKWNVDEYIKYASDNNLNTQWAKELENASTRVHISRLDSLRIQLQNEVEKLYNEQLKGMAEIAETIYEDNYYHTAYEIQTGSNVAWNLKGLDSDKIAKILNLKWTDNSNFSSKIWENKQSLLNTLSTGLTQNFIRGDSPDKLIKQISKQFNTDLNKAGRLVMTESAFFASEAQKDCYKDLDVEKYQIIGTLDTTTCENCGALDKQVFDMKDFQEGITAPPFHPWCRCTTAPYFEDEEGTRIARDSETGETYYVDSDMSYEEWKARYVDNVNQKQQETNINNLNNKENNDTIYKKLSEDEYFEIAEKHRENISEDIRNSIYVTNWDNMQTLNKYGYINSNYSRHINYIKRTGDTEAFTTQEVKEFNKTISNLEKAIENNTIDKDIQATRYLDIDWFENKLDKQTYREIKYMKKYEKLEKLKGQEILDNQFISGSLQEEFNVYADRKLKMIIQADKGTNAFITENKMEREIIFDSSRLLVKEVLVKDDLIEVTVKILK